jgi:hypothetical protein
MEIDETLLLYAFTQTLEKHTGSLFSRLQGPRKCGEMMKSMQTLSYEKFTDNLKSFIISLKSFCKPSQSLCFLG